MKQLLLQWKVLDSFLLLFLLMMFKCKLGQCSVSHMFSMNFCESINLSSIYSKIFAVSSWHLTFWIFKDRLRIIGAHLMAIPKVSSTQTPEISGSSPRTRPPSWMLPVPLQPLAWRFTFEMWKGAQRHPLFTNREFTDWVLVSSSVHAPSMAAVALWCA